MMASLDCEAIIFLLDYRQSLFDGNQTDGYYYCIRMGTTSAARTP